MTAPLIAATATATTPEGPDAATEGADQLAMHRRVRESEQRLRQLADAMPQQVWTATPDGMLDYVNAQVTGYSGHPVADLLGQGWARMVHPDDLPAAAGTWASALAAGEPYEVEFRLMRHDGAYRWHIGRALPTRDEAGGVNQWFGTNTDIHDHKTALAQLTEAHASLAAQGEEMQAQHEELQSQHEELEALTVELGEQKRLVDDMLVQRTTERDRFFTYALDLMLTCSPDGTLTRANPAFLETLGHEAGELIGTSLLGLIHPDDQAATVAELGRLAEGAKTFRFENRYRRKDGAYRTLDWTAVYEEETIFAFARDVTERHEAAARIERQGEELRRADQMKDQFLGILSHELRTPLNAIQGFGSVLEDGVVGELTPPQATYVGKILKSSDALLCLVEDLLDMSRVQAGKFSLEPHQTAGLGELDGVAEQVRQGLDDAVGIGQHHPLADPDLDLDVGRAGEPVHLRGGHPEQLGGLQRQQAHREPPGLDPLDVEDVVDEASEPVAAVHRDRDHPCRLR
jgi:PAS domain S-box-containing protein